MNIVKSLYCVMLLYSPIFGADRITPYHSILKRKKDSFYYQQHKIHEEEHMKKLSEIHADEGDHVAELLVIVKKKFSLPVQNKRHITWVDEKDAQLAQDSSSVHSHFCAYEKHGVIAVTRYTNKTLYKRKTPKPTFFERNKLALLNFFCFKSCYSLDTADITVYHEHNSFDQVHEEKVDR